MRANLQWNLQGDFGFCACILHPEEWAASFTLCVNVSGLVLKQTLPKKGLKLILFSCSTSSRSVRASLSVFACCKWLKSGLWEALWTKKPRIIFLLSIPMRKSKMYYNDRFNFSYRFNRWVQLECSHYDLMNYPLASLSYSYYWVYVVFTLFITSGFLKPVLKVMYTVNSCLANPDNKSVSHSTICNINLLWATWGVVMLIKKVRYGPINIRNPNKYYDSVAGFQESVESSNWYNYHPSKVCTYGSTHHCQVQPLSLMSFLWHSPLCSCITLGCHSDPLTG